MLTDTAAKNAKRKDRPYKLSDRDGLYLYVSTTGAKSWRYDYRHAGKRYTLTHGPYPEVSLGEARDRHGVARKALERGQNPSLVKRQERMDVLTAAGNTFEAVVTVWYAGKAKARSPSWQEKRN